MYRICIAGRPNVGKSTLFNRLARRRIAITDAMPGVTRDAVTAVVRIGPLEVLLVDTGGIADASEALDSAVRRKSTDEMARADLVLLVVDALERTGEDDEVLAMARRSGRPAILVVNKVDTDARRSAVDEWWATGIPHLVAISAAHGLGIDELHAEIESLAATDGVEPIAGGAGGGETGADRPVRLAIVGQPNTGKSSLLNRLIGEDRAIVSDRAGTTRDVVEAEFDAGGLSFRVVDTAGIRRRSRVEEAIEYYSVTRALDAIERSELAILVVDAVKGLSEQDKKIAARISDRGSGVVVALNKWDLVDRTPNARNAIIDRVRFLFPVFDHVPIVPISARDGTGIDELLPMLATIQRQLRRRVETAELNARLRTWIEATPPPSGRRPVKIRYMTQVTTNPIRFVLFVNRPRSLPRTYLGYIRNQLRRDCGFTHVPLFIDVRG